MKLYFKKQRFTRHLFNLKYVWNAEENLLPKFTAGRWRFCHSGMECLDNHMVDLEIFFKKKLICCYLQGKRTFKIIMNLECHHLQICLSEKWDPQFWTKKETDSE